MSQPAESSAIIAPPRVVVIAAVLVILQAVGVLVLAVVNVASGLGHHAALGQLLAQGAYYLVLAVLMAVCGIALLRGRRWGRTPVIVLQIVLGAVGYWLAIPSERLLPGLAVVLVAVVTGGLLLSPPANVWISRFPPLFGPAPDH